MQTKTTDFGDGSIVTVFIPGSDALRALDDEKALALLAQRVQQAAYRPAPRSGFESVTGVAAEITTMQISVSGIHRDDAIRRLSPEFIKQEIMRWAGGDRKSVQAGLELALMLDRALKDTSTTDTEWQRLAVMAKGALLAFAARIAERGA